MEIAKPTFSAPLLVIDDFLPEDEAALCLQECIDLRPVYMPARVGQAAENRVDRKIRQNEVVYLDSVFSSAPERSKILTLVKRQLASPECNRLWHQGYTIFDIINYANYQESVLSRYGKCDFYGFHQDTKQNRTSPAEIHHRLVTVVYYMNTVPERFRGGALTLKQDASSVTVQPRHNRLVVFPSFVYHAVENVQLDESEPFSAARFSLNLWIGFK
jgi:Rps23 Pro-64 3,4-dihydroxylase Tpa1-like proline 4-hydroxylase